MSIVWLNGELLDEADARISPFDHGLLTGDGVFETLQVLRGAPFAARRHLERLGRSAAGLRLPCPAASVVVTAMGAVIAANGLEVGRLRVTLTGGPSPLGSDRAQVGPTVLVAGGPLSVWPESTEVVVAPSPRNERSPLAGLKTISYAESIVALAFAHDRGAGEALFGNLAGNLCEGTGTNVFVGIGGRLVTPPLTAGCLPGVTRDLLLGLVDVAEDDMALSALGSADEAFLTSSTRNVQAIRAVDGRPLPVCPGPLTAAAAQAFRELLGRDLDP